MRTVVLHQCSSSPPRFILTASTIGPRTEALDGGLSCACRSVADFLEHVGPQLRRVALECRELPRQDARMGRLGRQPPASAAVGRAVYFFCGRVQSLDLGFLEIPHCPPSCDAVPEVIMQYCSTQLHQTRPTRCGQGQENFASAPGSCSRGCCLLRSFSRGGHAAHRCLMPANYHLQTRILYSISILVSRAHGEKCPSFYILLLRQRQAERGNIAG